MDEIAQDLIERYHQNALNPEEKREFQRRINTDDDFAKEVQWHELALEAIRLEGEKELRRRLTIKGIELDVKNPNRSAAFPWQWVLLLIVVLALGLWFIYPENTTKEPISPAVPNEKSLPAPPSSPKPVDPAPSPPQAQTEPASVDGKKLFAAYFEPYRDASLEPSVRGSVEEISHQEHFQQLYWEGEYAQALLVYDSLETFAQRNDNLLFLKANCLLNTGNVVEATGILEKIILNSRSRFTTQAPWYLALCRLQREEWEPAERLLQQIAKERNSPRRADADRLLSENKPK